MEPELKPCPKCGKQPYMAVGFNGGKWRIRVICASCGLHTRDFEDTSGNDEIYTKLQQQSADAWNGGHILVTVEDLSINYERLSLAAEQLGLFLVLVDEGGLEPTEKVKRWDAIRREMRDSVRLVRKEVETTYTPLPTSPLKGGGEIS